MPVLYADLSIEKTIVSNYKAVISDSVNHCFIGWISFLFVVKPISWKIKICDLGTVYSGCELCVPIPFMNLPNHVITTSTIYRECQKHFT